MSYFLIYKTDKKKKVEKPIVLRGGYSFAKKISITLYNPELTRYILKKKINSSLKGIINLYLVCESVEDGDDDAREALAPKIELLRQVLLERYAFFLPQSDVEDYLNKLEKMEKKVGMLQSKKSRSL